jgi:ADP-heptose:LPS heptosyltransferase
MDLPALMKIQPDAIPAPVPYLSVDPIQAASYRSKLAPGRNIGLVWAGRPTHTNDANRSMSLETFASLLRLPGITWHSLQLGPAASQRTVANLPLNDPTESFRDFHDTAAFVAQLDLVISVDTAVAHLAGALARPVWALLPFASDWRWLASRDDSPWYPTMRLFRQSAKGDWTQVIERMKNELSAPNTKSAHNPTAESASHGGLRSRG